MTNENGNGGSKPDLISFNILLNAFYKNSRFADGIEIVGYWAMMEIHSIVPDGISLWGLF